MRCSLLRPKQLTTGQVWVTRRLTLLGVDYAHKVEPHSTAPSDLRC